MKTIKLYSLILLVALSVSLPTALAQRKPAHAKPTGMAAAIAAPGHKPDASISAVWIEGLDPEEVAPDVVAAADEIATALWR